MKVKELIALLEKIENKERRVEVAVRTYTRAYPVAYLEPFDRDYLGGVEDAIRINVSFGEGYSVAHRKPKSLPAKP